MRALITGITGQDGAYLAEFLIKKGYEVYGTFRRSSTPNFWRLQYLGIHNKVKLLPMDLIDSSTIYHAIQMAQPDEIYHLAAQSFVGASFEQPESTGAITGLGTVKILEAIVDLNRNIRFYNAATSELYGNSTEKIKGENSRFEPRSPYAAAKLYSFWVTKIYREAYGIFASNGILFNHESPLRGLEFVTRKISNSVARIALGLQKKLILGNMSARRDWGYAPDYVEAMWYILHANEPDDFVVATGESHSVKEFVDVAFSEAGIDQNGKIEISKDLFRPLEVNELIGDYSKIRETLKWQPKVDFDGVAKIMVREDLKRWSNFINGRSVIWDAPLYPEDLVFDSSKYYLDP